MNYQTTPIMPPQQPKKKSRFGLLVLNFLRVALLIIAGFAVLICATPLWSWMHCDGQPTQMSFEDYLNKGSDNDWVVLTGVYVDGSNRIETQMIQRGQSTGNYAGTYFPLRSGPDDKRPIKVFLDPSSYTDSRPQVVLSYVPGAPPDRELGPNDRQIVRGMRARGIYFPGDLESVLHSSKLGTTDDIILIKQSHEPISNSTAATMIAVMAGSIIIFVLTFLFRRKNPTKA